jgi:hypothetical protein
MFISHINMNTNKRMRPPFCPMKMLMVLDEIYIELRMREDVWLSF